MTDAAAARGTGAAASPSNSPRLPSPPPLPELQLGPRSPSISASPGELQLESAAQVDEGASRRIRPGTSAIEIARGPPFVPLHQVESPFQLQEYLKSYYCKLTRDDAANTVKPITRESAIELTSPPTQQDTGEPVDRHLWLYELCRFLVQRSNRLIVAFFSDSPPCSSQTCPEMRASEWQYLCAVHEPPKSCCAIDYCCHTLDWAGNVLTSPRHFPSRLSLGGDGGNIHASMKQLVNIFRRVYRIFAHAWFQHRDVFWAIEQEEGLYKFFKTVCDSYSLIPEDGYTIPSEAEDEREDGGGEAPVHTTGPSFTILHEDSQPTTSQSEVEDNTAAASTAATTRRHRHTPSTGTQVTMIAEGAEDEDEEGEGNITQIQTKIVQPETATSEVDQADTITPTDANETISTSKIDFAEGAPRIEMPSQAEIVRPADPTPTPERHSTDPFDSSSEADASSDANTLSSATSTETSPATASSAEESPASSTGESTQPDSTNTLTGKIHHELNSETSETAPDAADAADAEAPSKKKDEATEGGSDDEEMGEIKLVEKEAEKLESSTETEHGKTDTTVGAS